MFKVIEKGSRDLLPGSERGREDIKKHAGRVQHSKSKSQILNLKKINVVQCADGQLVLKLPNAFLVIRKEIFHY